MRKTIFIGIAATIILVIGVLVITSKSNKNQIQNQDKFPAPKTIVLSKEDESGEWQQRLQWIEQIHKCDTNINWRTINYEVRKEKAKLRKDYSKNKSGIISIGTLEGQWRETGSQNLAGRTHYTEYDSETDSIYCASSGGNIWKANLNGNGWRVLNDGSKIEDIKMIRKITTTQTRLLVASGGWSIPGFYYSDDDGLNWTASTGLSNISDWGYVIKAVVANDAQRTIYLLAMEWNYTDWEKQTSLYVSTNQGLSFSRKASWLESASGSEDKFDIWGSREGSTCYIFANGALNVIDNTDFSIDLIGSPVIANPGNILLTGCKTETQTYFYVGVYTGNYVEFYQSTNGGINWTAKGTIPQGPFMKNSFTVSQKYPETLYYGGVECFKSTNGGNIWTKINTWEAYYSDIEHKLHADIPGINSYVNSENNEIVFINTDGGTYISNNQLQSVQNISLQNHNIGQFYSVYSHRTNNNVIFGGTQDQGYQFCNTNTGSGTAQFTQILSGDYGHIVSSNGGNNIWMVYPGFAAYYPFAVDYPYNSYLWEFTIEGQFWIPPLMADPNNPNVCFLGGGSTGSGTHLFRLVYSNSSVIATELAYDFSGNTGADAISAMACSTISPNDWYVMNGNGEFFYSNNSGATWTLTTGFDGPDGDYLYGASIIPSTSEIGVVYVAGSGYSNPPVFKSTNNGNNFSAMSNGLPSTMVYEMAIVPGDNYIFAATDAGPYVFLQEDNLWHDLAQNFAPDQTYWTVDYNQATQTARFGTYGRGIWDFKLTNGLLSETSKKTESFIYPNPASDYINISLDGDETKIYNLRGESLMLVRKGKNDISALKSGVYIVSDGKHSSKFIKL